MFVHCIATWKPKPIGRRPREERVFERDGWRCTVPGCTSQRNLHAHHVVFRSAGGSDDDANLTTLCAAHHQRGVHAGVIRITGRAPGSLVFELPLGRFASGDRALA
jgi:5-methylcytosine-specific restriction endonuclease McrA